LPPGAVAVADRRQTAESRNQGKAPPARNPVPAAICPQVGPSVFLRVDVSVVTGTRQSPEYFIASDLILCKLDGVRLASPREFDESAALAAAMECFWAAGYAATSVRDLGDAMGLGAVSLYNVFGV